MLNEKSATALRLHKMTLTSICQTRMPWCLAMINPFKIKRSSRQIGKTSNMSTNPVGQSCAHKVFELACLKILNKFVYEYATTVVSQLSLLNLDYPAKLPLRKYSGYDSVNVQIWSQNFTNIKHSKMSQSFYCCATLSQPNSTKAITVDPRL